MADATEQTKTFKQDPRNARRHNDRNVELIATSILDNGFGRSILLANDGTIIAGNATALAAGQAGLDNAMVIESDGTKIIAVKRTDVDPGSDEFYRLSIYDNRASELATWDPAVLTALQEEGVDLSPFWDDEELGALLATLDDAHEPLVDPDTVPELPKEATTKPGDVWQIGRHRLMCGDSTVVTDVEQLMNGERADMVFTDPPYGVSYVGGVSHDPRYAEKRKRNGMTLESDNLSESALRELIDGAFSNMLVVSNPGSPWYITAPPGPLNLIPGQALHRLGVWRQTINWVKSAFVFGRSDYHYRHEPIFYGWVEGAAHHFTDDRTQDTIWEFPRPLGDDNPGHPTAKPVDLISRAIANSSKPDDLILDLFGGSGSTLIACEQTGRRCAMMEIDPIYCDVIIARAAQTFGLVAELVS